MRLLGTGILFAFCIYVVAVNDYLGLGIASLGLSLLSFSDSYRMFKNEKKAAWGILFVALGVLQIANMFSSFSKYLNGV